MMDAREKRCASFCGYDFIENKKIFFYSFYLNKAGAYSNKRE